MAYTIYNNDGTVLTTIAVGEVDTYSTSLDLVGQNLNNYGEYINGNFVKLLTSFASNEVDQPRSPQIGQLWFDKTMKRLKVYDGVDFIPTYGSQVSGVTPITTSTGDFWYDTVNSQLKVWNGNNFKLIGPAVSGLIGKFGIEPPATRIYDDSNNGRDRVSIIHSYGSYIGALSTSAFTMNTTTASIYFSSGNRYIANGMTLFNDLAVKGSISSDNVILSGGRRVSTDQDLTASYTITPFGTYTATISPPNWTATNTNLQSYDAANYAIANDLAKMFSTSTYFQGARVSVLCYYNTTTSVRKFELQQLNPPRVRWEPYNNYAYTYTATSTSTIGQVTWLWTTTNTTTNIVLEGY